MRINVGNGPPSQIHATLRECWTDNVDHGMFETSDFRRRIQKRQASVAGRSLPLPSLQFINSLSWVDPWEAYKTLDVESYLSPSRKNDPCRI